MAEQVTVALVEARRELAQQVRAAVRSQQALWRGVPYRALLAEQSEEVGGTLRRTYTAGLWHVAGQVHVECSSGELVTRGRHQVPDTLLVSELPGEDELWRIDAEKVVAHLTEETETNPLAERIPGEVSAWRRRMVAEGPVHPLWGAHQDPDPVVRRRAETFARLAPEWHGTLDELWETTASL